MTPTIPGLSQAPPIEHIGIPEPEPTPAAKITNLQINLSKQEQQRLYSRIWENFMGAESDHQVRIERFRRYYRMWRGLLTTEGNRDVGPDLQVPLLKWTLYGQWAKVMGGLIGEDAEVVARPTSPEDEKSADKTGHYMSWRVFEYMRGITPLAILLFRALLFGRGHGELEYCQEFFWERWDENRLGPDGKPVGAKYTQQELDRRHEEGLREERVRSGVWDFEELKYDGPKLKPLWPSQIIVPSQDGCITPQDFEWKIRRDRRTPQQLLDGEIRGHYQNIRDNWDAILAAAQLRQERDYWWDHEMVDADEAEGVDHVTTMASRDSVEVWVWYGKWRLPKGKRDSRPENIKYRDTNQSDLKVTIIPKCNLVIGVQDCRDIYPRTAQRDPIVSIATTKDGSYWPPGIGELLEDLQNELTINHAIFRQAGFLSVGPLIFYNPSGGFDPGTFKYEPGQTIPTNDAKSVNVVRFEANTDFNTEFAQVVKGYAELVEGVNDQTLGQSSDRPNAPRTASGQAMLLNEGNVRATLDMNMLREDLGDIFSWIWTLDREYASAQVFFRVTGDDPTGFDVDNGFGVMTAQDREAVMTFDLKFATSVWSKEAKKERILQLYQLSMANPIVQTNPRALWVMLNRVWKALGEDDFKGVVPEPPELDTPKMPKDEWALMERGEIVHVNPLDDDLVHMTEHRRRLQGEVNQDMDRRDAQLEHMVMAHIAEHEQQYIQKQALQQMVMKAMQAAQAAQQSQPQSQAFPAPAPPSPAPGVAPPPAPQQPQLPAAGAPAPAPPQQTQ